MASKDLRPGDQLEIGYQTDIKVRSFDKVSRLARLHSDDVWRMDKDPSDRLNVRMTIEITGNLRRADLDRFAQAMAKTAAFEFEDGGGGQ